MIEIEIKSGNFSRSFNSPCVPRAGEYVHFDDGEACFEVNEVYYDVQHDGSYKVRLFAEMLAPVK